MIVGLEGKAQGRCFGCAEMPGGGTAEDRARLFSVISSEKTRDNGNALKYRRLHLYINKPSVLL